MQTKLTSRYISKGPFTLFSNDLLLLRLVFHRLPSVAFQMSMRLTLCTEEVYFYFTSDSMLTGLNNSNSPFFFYSTSNVQTITSRNIKIRLIDRSISNIYIYTPWFVFSSFFSIYCLLDRTFISSNDCLHDFCFVLFFEKQSHF